MLPTHKHSPIPPPPMLPALVVIAALIVLAGLLSLHTGAVEPAGAAITHLL